MFKSKAQEVAITEEALKDEANEVRERLEILQVIKRREKLKSERD